MTEVATGRSAAEQLVGDLLITVSKTEVMQGVTAWRNPKNGFKIVDLENVAHPGKRSSEWLLQARQGIPKAEFEREYGKKWVVYDGKPVYDDYDEDIHMARGAIFAKGRCRLISGWDAGPNDVNLAWALGLAFPQYRAITFIDDTTFMLSHDGPPDGTGYPGIERGSYTWDQETGAITTNVQVDTNGEWGVSNSGTTILAISSDNKTLIVEGSPFATRIP